MVASAVERRLLWVTEEPPDRDLGGGNIRQAHLFEALAGAFPVDLLVTGQVRDERVRSAAAEVVELPVRRALHTEHPAGRRLLELGISLGSPYPLAAYGAAPARRALAAALRSRVPGAELVCVEHEALAPLLRRSGAERWLVTFHNLLSGIIEAELSLAPGRRQRWFRRRDLGKAQRLERSALSRYDRCVVCSSDDRASLAALGDPGGDARIAVVPNGVDLGRFAPSRPPEQPTVLFPGTFAYPPNVDGAIWFCSEIWPRVRAAVPEANLILAGRAPVPAVRRLGQLAGVVVHPDVPSMIDYFEAARVVVVPIRLGTGTRLKALEAMAAARPVVGTSVGLAGIGIVDGVQARVADDAEGFAAALVETLRPGGHAAVLGAAGRRHVEARFAWESIGRRYVGLVSEVLEERPRTSRRRTGG